MLKFGCQASKQKGLMLIELLISIGIGLTLISILLGMYVASCLSLRLQHDVSIINDSAIRAARILETQIHQAGKIGCAKLTPDFPIYSYQQYSLTAQNKLIGTTSDITLRFASYPVNTVLTAPSNQTILRVTNRVRINPGDVMVIANCQHAEIVRVANVEREQGVQTIKAVQPLKYEYSVNSEISRLEINRYYVARTKRKDNNGKPIYALFLEDIKHKHYELVEGVGAIEIAYTINQSGVNQDVSANRITNWAAVLGVNISMQVVSNHLQKTWYMYAAI